MRDLVADAYALIRPFAETHTHVTQRKTPSTVEFDITTGMLEGDGPFRDARPCHRAAHSGAGHRGVGARLKQRDKLVDDTGSRD